MRVLYGRELKRKEQKQQEKKEAHIIHKEKRRETNLLRARCGKKKRQIIHKAQKMEAVAKKNAEDEVKGGLPGGVPYDQEPTSPEQRTLRKRVNKMISDPTHVAYMSPKTRKKSHAERNAIDKTMVFYGVSEKTVHGLKKTDLVENKAGKIVNKKRSESGTKWGACVKKAKTDTGSVGQAKKGTPLYTKAKDLYDCYGY